MARFDFPVISRSLRAAPVAVLAVCAANSADAKRLAFVVGNSSYESVYSLKNAAKDAGDVARTLEALDFDVTLVTDADQTEFWDALNAFAARADAEDAESTLFYFSGHAFQLDGANYLIPSDASLSNRSAIESETWRLDEIVARLEDRNRQTLIFLDACRNNPLPEGQRGGTQSGLAKLETGSGTFVAFATQPNNVTADGAGDNSPFTSALISRMETKGISISDMMIEVRNEVEDSTFGRQTPWDQSSLRAQFYFNPVVERSAKLTDADYEMIASLPPETRSRLLAAMGKAGLRIEEAEIEDAKTAIAVVAHPAFTIEDVDGDLGEKISATREVLAAKPEEPGTGDAIPALLIYDVPDTELAARAGARAPRLSVRTPRESSVQVVLGRVPGTSTDAQLAQAVAGANGATLGGTTTADLASGTAAQRQAAAATGTVLGTSGGDTTVPGVPSGAERTQVVAGANGATLGGTTTADLASGTAAQRQAAAATGTVLGTSGGDTTVPGVPSGAERTQVVAGANSATLGGTTTADLASGTAAQRQAAAATGTVLGTSGGDNTILTAATDDQPQAGTAAGVTAGLQPSLAAVLPPDPGQPDDALLGEAGIILASIGATRSVAPIPADYSRVPGAELTLDAAADLGITIEAPEPDLVGRDLARAVQVELQRLGCYRMAIDGAFGKGSRLALARYYGNRRLAPNAIDPSNALLRILRAEDSVICKGTQIQDVRVAKVKKKITSDRKAKAVAKKPTRKKTTKTTKKQRIEVKRKKAVKNTGRTTKRSIKRINTRAFR